MLLFKPAPLCWADVKAHLLSQGPDALLRSIDACYPESVNDLKVQWLTPQEKEALNSAPLEHVYDTVRELIDHIEASTITDQDKVGEISLAYPAMQFCPPAITLPTEVPDHVFHMDNLYGSESVESAGNIVALCSGIHQACYGEQMLPVETQINHG